MAVKTKVMGLAEAMEALKSRDVQDRLGGAAAIHALTATDKGMGEICQNDVRGTVSSLVECLVKEKQGSEVLFHTELALRKINSESIFGNIAVYGELQKHIDNPNAKDLFIGLAANKASKKDRSMMYG